MNGEGMSEMRQAIFLDRDGTINWNEVRGGRPYAPTRLEDFRYLPGVVEAMARFKAEGHLLIVVTNQPDLSTGKNSLSVIEAMHARLREELGVDDIFICPHTEEQDCGCRKPRPGLLLAAAEKWAIDLSRSIMVGDRWRDVDAGRAAGCATVHIDQGYAGEPVAEGADFRVPSLGEAADFIVSELARRRGA
jgi:D-glycero-D-manno-heptose 1,7-bisphosphate phosphatase